VGAVLGCERTISVPFLGSDETLRAEALSAMHPREVPPAFDASQQLGELFECFMSVIHLLESIERIIEELTKLNKWNSPSVRRILGQRTIRDISLKNWGDLAVAAGLTWQLAISPMLNAIGQAERARAGYKQALQRILDGEVTLHGRAIRTANGSSTNGTSDYHKFGCDWTYELTVCTSARVKYASPKTEGLIAAFDKAYYGLSPNWSTAYELYSLSFILDWFWDFGTFLNRSLRKPLDDISYTVLWTGWSKKTVTTRNGWIDMLEGTLGSAKTIKDQVDPNQLITGTRTTSTYMREAMPLSLEEGLIPSPTLQMPDLGKLATLAALVYAMATGRQRFIEAAKRVPVSIAAR
jgi:hypothetical protein